MKTRTSRFAATLVGFGIVLTGGQPALADDSEIYLDAVSAAQKIKPNVLILMDTSISMQAEVLEEKGSYDNTKTYPNISSCRNDRYYWIDATNGDPGDAGAPKCSNDTKLNQYVVKAAIKCAPLLSAIDGPNSTGTGSYYNSNNRFAHWNSNSKAWETLRNSTAQYNPTTSLIECEVDNGVHGIDAASAAKWLRNTCSNGATVGCYANTNQSYSWTSRKRYRWYSGNYLNWLYSAAMVPTGKTRTQVAMEAAKDMVDSSNNMRIGLMQMSRKSGSDIDAQGEGGMVLKEIADVTTNGAAIKTAIDGLKDETYTSSAELFYEALQYYRGGAVDYGLASGWFEGSTFVSKPSVPASRVTGNQSQYKTPIEYKCQRNYAIFISDGVPRGDRSVEKSTRVGALPGWQTAVGHSTTYCDGSANGPSGFGSPDGGGRCLDDVVSYMANADLSALPGRQNVITHMVGFSEEVSGEQFLEDAAKESYDRAAPHPLNVWDVDDQGNDIRPKGQFFQANTSVQLSEVLKAIKIDIDRQNVSFTAPTISVDAYNRTRMGERAYVSVFRSDTTDRWYGNIKKYKLVNGKLLDSRDVEAVGSNGFFSSGSRSIWSNSVDGDEAVKGGAANELPDDPTTRKIYTNITAGDLTAAGNAFVSTNSNITDTMLDRNSSDPTKATLINFMRGTDIFDEDKDLSVSDGRRIMGDPIHSRPVTVTYSKAAPTPILVPSDDETDEERALREAQAIENDDAIDKGTVVYAATNEGMLHAIDAQTGKELWAFLPKELISRTKLLYNNQVSSAHNYGIDGDITVLKYDAAGDGDVNGSDRVYLFFGLRRGGSYYYGLDVTDKEKPSLLWVKGKADWPGLGQAWSTPAVARVRITPRDPDVPVTAAFEDQDFVLIMGGGYADTQEHYNHSADTEGNALFMVNAKTGALIWRAGFDTGANLVLNGAANRMDNAIPSEVSVIDLDGDQYADRMYVGDMGGRIWRFDIWNNINAANLLVTGGVFARLGAAGIASPTIANTRRFYSRPDVSLVGNRGAGQYLNIAIGSGYRGHPLHKATTDRFFALRDRTVGSKLSQSTYNSMASTSLLPSDLVDVTSNLSPTLATDVKGWYIDLVAYGAGRGEKVLAESTTVEGEILFTTYTPPTATVQPCDANQFGNARAYRIRAEDGAALGPDRSTQIDVAGIPPGVTVVLGDELPPNTTQDTDGDGLPDYIDPDIDNDGIKNEEDDDVDGSHSQDTDGDGTPDYADPDDDNDGAPDAVDSDDDGDGIPDSEEVVPPPPPPGGPLPTCWVGPKKLEQCVKPGTKLRTYWFKQAG
jgi:type IV pilus assembly protein PilY1